MATTYEKIATTTLGSANAVITFSTIPATYTDLRIILVAQGNAGNDLWMRYNGDSGTNYSITWLQSNGTAAASFRTTSAAQLAVGAASGLPTASNWGLLTADIFSYAGSTNKTSLSTFADDKNGSGTIESTVGLWRSTAAITSITLTSSSSGTFSTGTTATLYGILKA
jgi:hypothetical protein